MNSIVLADSLKVKANIASLRLNHSFDRLPDSIAELTCLRKLTLNCRPLRDLNEICLGSLTTLTSLIILENLTTSLDTNNHLSNLICLKQLQVISCTRIKMIGPFFASFTNLCSLDLSQNQLDFLPDSIGNCFSLTSLILKQNDISHLPHSFENLTNLKELNLSRCVFSNAIGHPFGSFCKLHSLNLSSNNISSIEADVAATWTALTCLVLNNNQLTSLPDEANQWESIKGLFLHGNKLKTINDTAAESWHCMTRISVDDNPLNQLPQRILHDWNSLEVCGLRNTDVSSRSRNTVDQIISRNKRVQWWRVLLHLLELSLIFYNHLPAYVLLEVFDFLPDMQYLNHRRKIMKIIRVYRSLSELTERKQSIETGK